MRKFFSFRSSAASSSGPSNPSVAPNSDQVYWETPWESSVKNCDKIQDNSQSHKDSASSSGLKRSLSFSSSHSYSGPGRNLNSSSGLRGSPSSNSNVAHQADDYPIRCRSLTPERQYQAKRGDQAAIRKTYAADKLESPSSSRGYHNSSGNSPYSSPVPLRCRAARVTQVSNKILDLYIDGEQEEDNMKARDDFQKDSPPAQNDACSLDTRTFANSRRPPRVQSTAPASPTISKERMRSHSFREARDARILPSTRDWKSGDVRPASPQKLAKNVVERLSQVFPRKCKIKLQDIDSETTTTVEDIFEDYSNPHPSSTSNCITQTSSLSENMSSSCNFSDAPYGVVNGYQSEDIWKKNHFLQDGTMGKPERSLYSGIKNEDLDAELHRKGKEANERVMMLSEDLEQLNLQNCSFSIAALLQMIRNVTEDRRNLALEVSTQIQNRVAERASATEALKLAKVELDSRTIKLEKEKNELQSSLEKELDRRSREWSSKLEKYQAEEQRLRERVRELAEQNVSLQREVSSLNGREVETRSSMMRSELQLNELTKRMEEATTNNHNLQQDLLELQERSSGAVADRDCIRRSYKEKEKENNELQKAVARLQRICSEQEKTIGGLRQGLVDEIEKHASAKDDNVGKLQMEQVRLTGVEQMLRRELESCRLEVESLRRENINLLNRLQGSRNGGGFSSLKLDEELIARVHCLQNQGLSLLDETNYLCGKLVESMKEKRCRIHENPNSGHEQEVSSGLDDYSIVECEMKFQSFKRAVENLRKSLQATSEILQEKSDLDALESQLQSTGACGPGSLKDQTSECDVEHELKAEILVTKVLREKLCFKEIEIEQMQAELATSVRAHDILRCEVERAQDSLLCLTHKMKDLELQKLNKDDNINQLQNHLQNCMKELTVTRGILQKISSERDMIWDEVKQYREENMLLNCEVTALRKKVEVLDEDILIKEGQISILKDSIDNKPYDILYSPKSTKEFVLE